MWFKEDELSIKFTRKCWNTSSPMHCLHWNYRLFIVFVKTLCDPVTPRAMCANTESWLNMIIRSLLKGIRLKYFVVALWVSTRQFLGAFGLDRAVFFRSAETNKDLFWTHLSYPMCIFGPRRLWFSIFWEDNL